MILDYNKRSCVDLSLLFYLSGDRLESDLKRETTEESTSFIRSINCYGAEMHTGHLSDSKLF